MTIDQVGVHGDPSQWKFQNEKNGSGAQGDNPGDVKYYEVWMDAFRRLLEIHYFKDAGGQVKASTITIRPYSP